MMRALENASATAASIYSFLRSTSAPRAAGASRAGRDAPDRRDSEARSKAQGARRAAPARGARGPRARCGSPRTRRRFAAPASPCFPGPHPRIEPRVGEVDEEIDRYEQRDDDAQIADDHRPVEHVDRVDQELS